MFTLLLALGILYVYDIGTAKIDSFKSNKNYTELFFTTANLLAANSFKSTWTYLFSFGTVWKEMIYLKSHLPKHESIFFQSRSIFALIPIYTFQLSKIQIKINKYIGYLFYPVHITILLVIAKFI